MDYYNVVFEDKLGEDVCIFLNLYFLNYVNWSNGALERFLFAIGMFTA